MHSVLITLQPPMSLLEKNRTKKKTKTTAAKRMRIMTTTKRGMTAIPSDRGVELFGKSLRLDVTGNRPW